MNKSYNQRLDADGLKIAPAGQARRSATYGRTIDLFGRGKPEQIKQAAMIIKSIIDLEELQLVKMLKVDNNFTPCPINNGDELFPNGIFEFNIARILEYIENNPNEVELVEVAVDDFFKGFSSIDEFHVDSVEISRPVILAEISPGHYNLIDGNHRMEKARRMGITSILAYRLNVKQHMKFLTNKKAYLSYIEYWNSKLR